MCARVCAVCSLALGDEDGGIQLVSMHRICRLVVRVILNRRRDWNVVCVFSI